MMLPFHAPMDSTMHPILLLEQDASDAFRVKAALRKAGIVRPIRVVFDAADALCYMMGLGRFEDREQHPSPSMLIVSTTMAGSELDVVQWVRKQPDISGLPVIVLSGATDEDDPTLAYELGANACVAKPLTAPALDSFVLTVELCRGMASNWMLPAS